MPDSGFFAVFLVGILGGVHCGGMCGGIVSTLALQMPATKKAWPIHLAYNIGRITSYTVAGALMGALSNLGLLLNHWLPVQMALYVAAKLIMMGLGLYLIGMTRALAFTERAGQVLWRYVQPVTRRFLPVRGVAQVLPLGIVWCGDHAGLWPWRAFAVSCRVVRCAWVAALRCWRLAFGG